MQGLQLEQELQHCCHISISTPSVKARSHKIAAIRMQAQGLSAETSNRWFAFKAVWQSARHKHNCWPMPFRDGQQWYEGSLNNNGTKISVCRESKCNNLCSRCSDYEDYRLQRCVFFHREDRGNRLCGVTSQKTAIFKTANASANTWNEYLNSS